MKSLPGVQSAGAVSTLPLTGFWGETDFLVEGRPLPKPGETPTADNRFDYARLFLHACAFRCSADATSPTRTVTAAGGWRSSTRRWRDGISVAARWEND